MEVHVDDGMMRVVKKSPDFSFTSFECIWDEMFECFSEKKKICKCVCAYAVSHTPTSSNDENWGFFFSVSDVYDNPVALLEFFNPSQLLLVLVTAPNIFSCLFLNHPHILLLFCRFLLAFYYFTRLLLLLLIIFSTSE